jgi:quercetin dioxygenase-like cupin family protein
MKALPLIMALSIAGATAVMAQNPTATRTVISTQNFPEGYQTLTVMATIAKGTCTGRHTHPGVETGYVLEGDFVFKPDGEPEKRLKPGENFAWDGANKVHEGCAPGDRDAKILVIYVVEKGKPLVSPVTTN